MFLKSRESYFKLLRESLWKNYIECRKIEPDLPPLSEEDVMLRALEMEYKIFGCTTVITIYRRKMALLTNQIKKETDKFHLHVPVIEASTPAASDIEPEQINSEFIKASEMVFATPICVVEEKPVEETAIETPPVEQSPVGKKRVSRLINNEYGSFEPVKLSTQKPTNEDDLIAKAKEIEARLSCQLSLMSKSTGAVSIAKPNHSKTDTDRSSKSNNGTTRSSKPPSKESSKSSSFKSSKRSLDRQTSLDKFFTSKRQKLDSQIDSKTETTAVIPKSDGKSTSNSAIKSETSVKKEKRNQQLDTLFDSKSDVSAPKSSKKISSNEKPSPVKEIVDQKLDSFKSPIKRPAEKSKTSSKSAEKKKPSSPDKNKQDTANLVIKCLMPHYAAKKVGSRELFKALARHLSHVLRSLTPPLTGTCDFEYYVQHLLVTKYFHRRSRSKRVYRKFLSKKRREGEFGRGFQVRPN